MTSIDEQLLDQQLLDQQLLDQQLLQTIHRNCYHMTKDLIKKLILKGADVNYHDKHNLNTSLTLGVAYQNYDLCKLLVENGANVNQLNRHGNTLLMSCVGGYEPNRDIALMKLLLESGADADLVNKDGETALMIFKGYNKYYNLHLQDNVVILEEHIEKKKLQKSKRRLALSKLFYSKLGKNLLEEGLYEQISLLI